MNADVLDFYRGGMILFDMDIAYRYEYTLVALLNRRLKKYFNLPGRYRLAYMMRDEYEKREDKYAESDYWIEPGDPLVYIPECPKWLWLKSRHLHTLRLQAMKRIRQTHRRRK